MSLFLLILAYFIAIFNTIVLFAFIRAKILYDNFQKIIDRNRGGEKTYPLTIPIIASVLGWGWIIFRPY